MPSQARLRKTVLMDIYRQSGGDIERHINVAEMAESLAMPAKELVVIIGQLEAKTLARFGVKIRDHPEFKRYTVMITMHGIEEAEKMEQPLLRRWPSEHPVLLATLSSIGTGIVMLVLGKLLNIIF
jgi:DNA-binding MarR family transcriptional regulator